jgi:hypothetical protein
MRNASIRSWFCVAAATIAAAVADPIVEALANAGCFGRGTFTDHSNLDVVPGLLAGVLLLAVYVAVRVRGELLCKSSEALRAPIRGLLPVVLGIQVAVLFGMETIEQIVVTGHTLGGTIWLGGPAWCSLPLHAIVGIAFAYLLSAIARRSTRATVRVIRLLRALATRALHADVPLAIRAHNTAFAHVLAPALCRSGDRAPPFVLA